MCHPLRCFRLVVIALLMVLPSAIRAEEAKAPEPILLWPSGAPGESHGADREEQQPLRPGDTTVRITHVTRPTITVYRPKPELDTGAAVLICPGGAYKILAYNKEGTEVAEWLNTLGVTAIVLKYRVPAHDGRERHEAPIQDAQRALRLIRQRAKEWQVDPDRIGVLGFSAGGHLAALLSTDPAQKTYEIIDEVDRVSARPNFTILVYPAYMATKSDTLAPPLKVDAKTPPTFLVQTEDDGVRVESSIVYYLALKRANVSVEMHLYPRGGHGYGLRPSQDLVSSWPLRAEAWMKSAGVLKPGN
ncbi:alpha/beta hydrolase [Singulisphaera acidiphila]|uniref:Esterase/lipase n=1 Tax=Singulisphaera acidiphila (strain ATCC BAA-1392 / DSM 18658 / VKM B-2454 / MOB10) TaxID=886293 RepID=L0DLX0_SINAD|nr:alpha/beta hydrolase [Singulisphaera acidiphila]AGA29843.1 esterase/lipase [Singulisphaera acidiphila DSM 18658]